MNFAIYGRVTVCEADTHPAGTIAGIAAAIYQGTRTLAQGRGPADYQAARLIKGSGQGPPMRDRVSDPTVLRLAYSAIPAPEAGIKYARTGRHLEGPRRPTTQSRDVQYTPPVATLILTLIHPAPADAYKNDAHNYSQSSQSLS